MGKGEIVIWEGMCGERDGFVDVVRGVGRVEDERGVRVGEFVDEIVFVIVGLV